LLLFFLIFAVLATVLQFVVMRVPVLGAAMKAAHTGVLTPTGLFGYELANVGAALSAMLGMAKIEKRSLADYGLNIRTGVASRLLLGVVLGFATTAGIFSLQWTEHVYSFGSLAMPLGPAVEAACGWAAAFLLLAIAEESVFRGYAQFTLTRATGFWPAAVLISLLFGVTHLSNTSYKAAGILSAGLFGLFAAFCLWRTGDLWLPIGIHAAFDYAELFLFFAPHKGLESSAHLLRATQHGPGWLTGSTIGPEASINGYIVLSIAFVIVAALSRRPERGA
jgi:uncharacterized protein